MEGDAPTKVIWLLDLLIWPGVIGMIRVVPSAYQESFQKLN